MDNKVFFRVAGNWKEMQHKIYDEVDNISGVEKGFKHDPKYTYMECHIVDNSKVEETMEVLRKMGCENVHPLKPI